MYHGSWVQHELHTLCILKVMSPQWPNLVLTTNIPHSEADVLVFNGLHVEACTIYQKETWLYAISIDKPNSHFP